MTLFSRKVGHCAISILLISLAVLDEAKLFGQSSANIDVDKQNQFEKWVRPTLTQYCLPCHSSETESNGGLVLDSRYGWEKGGDSGRAIVPGSSEASLLIKAIRFDHPKLQMPPDKKLPSELVAIMEAWVNDGAFDPRENREPMDQTASNLQQNSVQEYWSYQPLRTANFTCASIDGFVNQKLDEMEILAAPLAQRRDQVRKLYLDLTGLPPSPETIRAMLSSSDFESDYHELVQRLLATPQYGESIARRWMDVVRYAESVTLRGLVFKEAWRYRDYVITAYNQDRSFDQMICEQIAGDLLKSNDPNDRYLQLVATTFMAMGDTNFEKQDKQQLEMDYVDEQLDVIGQAFLGQTIGCARCHDHKFDPIPTRDYYAMAGILKSAVALRHANVSNWIDLPLPLSLEEEKRFVELETQLQTLTKELATKKKQLAAKPKKEGESDGPDLAKENDLKQLADVVKQMESNQKKLQAQVDLRPRYLTIVEESPPKDIPVHIRGDVHNVSEVVPRGFLSALTDDQKTAIPTGASGRLEMSKWISAPNNPLTARVYANRVWSWMMGQGLVESVNNFGTTGTTPSNPDLLDWLATELIRSGWSTKHLIRLIVHSDAYRRKVVPADDRVLQIDPDNRFYWRGHQRRLTAEELRDAMLQASGELDLAMGGSLMVETKSDVNYKHSSQRRSVYHPLFRNSLPELLGSFDFPSTGMSVGQRSRSTVSTQALVLMNSDWVRARAKAMASRLRSESETQDPTIWIERAFQLCFQRPPNLVELETCLEFFRSNLDSTNPHSLEKLTHSLFASIDFRYLE
ncbi:MAG: PSD1 and planctomycete cytochrome C domain-containing protein [Pirellula sp.]|nr:PSD1 and planctomycete cytochrome C domain-containing protein [Pirellula sp.]